MLLLLDMSPRYNRIVILSIAIIIVLGFVTAVSISRSIDKNQRADLLKEAEQASLLVPATDIDKLSAGPADLENDTYKTLKQNLTTFRSFNPSIRFVYVLGYRPEIRTQFFYVDSEPVNSMDYSAPGALFTDTREQDIDSYLKGQPYTDGPYSDSWGEWVSGYAPIKDTQGEVVALLGIDTATKVWHQQIWFVRIVVSIITILLSLVAGFVISIVYKKQFSIDSLKKQNRTLIHSEIKLKEIQSMAQIGKIVCYFPEENFSFDEQFSQLLGTNPGDIIDRKVFISHIHPDDQKKFSETIESIINSDIAYTWVDVRIGSQDNGFRNYHIYGKIERSELLAPTRFSGIIQDITDIHS